MPQFQLVFFYLPAFLFIWSGFAGFCPADEPDFYASFEPLAGEESVNCEAVTASGTIITPVSAVQLKCVQGVRGSGVRIDLPAQGRYNRLAYTLPNPSTAWTVSVWIRMNEGIKPGEILRLEQGPGWEQALAVLSIDRMRNLQLQTWNERRQEGGMRISGVAGLSEDKWHHLAISAKGGVCKLFVDGHEVNGKMRSPGDGEVPAVRWLRFAGMVDLSLDELKVYSHQLTDEELARLADQLTSKVGDEAKDKTKPFFSAALNGQADGKRPEGDVPASVTEVTFPPAVLGEGALITRYGYDRKASLSFGPMENLFPPELTMSFFFIPNWDGSDKQFHGLLSADAKGGQWRLIKDGDGALAFILQGEKLSSTVKAPAAFLKKGIPVHLCAGYSKQTGKLFLAVEGREIALTPLVSITLPNTPGRLIVGDVPNSDVYQLTQAEGILDEIRLFSSRLSPTEILAESTRRTPSSQVSMDSALVLVQTNEKEKALWDLTGAYRTKTASREKITLNALWRCQLTGADKNPRPDGWMYMAVPGRYAGQETGGSETGFQLRDKELRKVPFQFGNAFGSVVWNGKPGHEYRNAWYERTFTADSAWADRRLLLVADELSPSQTAVMYLNGTPLAEWRDGRGYEAVIPVERLRSSGENFLTIHLSDKGGRWDWRGIKGDVWLELRPKTELRDVRILSSLRDKKLTVQGKIRNFDKVGRKIVLQCNLTGEGVPGDRFRTPVQELAPGQETDITIEIPWEHPRLWDLDDPYLYVCQNRLTDESGSILDELPPEQFGFREFRLEGGDFLLNNTRIHLRCDDNWYGVTAELEWCRRWVRELKALGFNSLRGVFDDKNICTRNIVQACNEGGVLLMLNAGGVTGESYSTWNNPQTRAQVEQRMRGTVSRFRNAPSVVMWYLSVNFLGYGLDYHPREIADGYTPEQRSAQAQACYEGAQMLRAMDISRPYFFQAGGAFGPVHTSNGYFGWWPMAEQMQWPEEWAKQRRKPLFMVETSFPYFEDWVGMDLQNGNKRPCLLPENAARFLGNEAYHLMGEKEEKLLGNHENDIFAFLFAFQKGSEAMWRVKSELLTNVLRAWRGAGVSGFLPFEELAFAFPRKNSSATNYHQALQTPCAPGDYRTPGWHPDVKLWPYQHDVNPDLPLTPVGKALKDVLSPVMAYLSGSNISPTSCDHVFYSGEIIEKSLVLINDSRKPQEFTWRWQLLDGSRKTTGISGSGTLRLSPADVERVPLRLSAPLVLHSPETYYLQVDVQRPDGVAVAPLKMQVYPACSSLSEEKKQIEIALFDPKGLTQKALALRGVAYRPCQTLSELTGIRLFVVGREGLTDAFAQEARRLHVAEAVRTGMVDVLIFEQTSLASLGLAMNATYSRDVFTSGDASDLLRGISPQDLSWPRGDGTLAEAYPVPELSPWNIVKSPFWHWGNINVAASLLPRRPGAIPSRAHLASGMDLLYAPLLEIASGKGRVFCCQYELTSRVGTDPAATALFDRLIALPQKMPPVRGRELYCLGAEAQNLVQRLGFSGKSISSPEEISESGITVVALKNAPLKEWLPILEAKANAGATLVTMAVTAEQANQLEMSMKPVEHLLRYELTDRGKDALGSLSERDCFVRGMWSGTALQGEKITALTNPALVVERRVENGRWLIVQLDPQEYDARYKSLLAQQGANSSQAWCVANLQDRLAGIWTALLRGMGAPADETISKRLEYPQGDLKIDLRGAWRFAIDPNELGEQEGWQTSEYNDSQWQKLRVPGTWEEQGITEVNPNHVSNQKPAKDYDGCAWYRLQVQLPKALRGRDLIFSAPKGIDDFDWVYINGVLIGHTGKETPGYWSAPRTYRIPAELAQSTIVIAIKVMDVQGCGGIVSDVVEIKTVPVKGEKTLYYSDPFPGYDTEAHIRW